MSSGRTFLIDRGGNFPTFCAVSFHGADHAVEPWVDFWAVSPGGDPTADYARGQRYAAEAVGHPAPPVSQSSSNACWCSWG
jgi:hypothetical protein